jgi:uncharacterized RDD family membrane protein YckC
MTPNRVVQRVGGTGGTLCLWRSVGGPARGCPGWPRPARQRFGLPESGPGSVAGVGRRLGALVIDWILCEIIAVAAFHNGYQYLTIVVFAVETYLLTALTGFTVGKRLLGLRVVRLDGKPVGLLWSLVRTLLFLAVIPPLVFDDDLRGLHDKAANTIVVRI